MVIGINGYQRGSHSVRSYPALGEGYLGGVPKLVVERWPRGAFVCGVLLSSLRRGGDSSLKKGLKWRFATVLSERRAFFRMVRPFGAQAGGRRAGSTELAGSSGPYVLVARESPPTKRALGGSLRGRHPGLRGASLVGGGPKPGRDAGKNGAILVRGNGPRSAKKFGGMDRHLGKAHLWAQKRKPPSGRGLFRVNSCSYKQKNSLNCLRAHGNEEGSL